MKSIKIQFTISIFLFLTFTLFATPPNPSIQSTTTSSGMPWVYDFGVNNLPNNVTGAFWILGDGHFRTGINITNQELINGNNNNVLMLIVIL